MFLETLDSRRRVTWWLSGAKADSWGCPNELGKAKTGLAIHGREDDSDVVESRVIGRVDLYEVVTGSPEVVQMKDEAK